MWTLVAGAILQHQGHMDTPLSASNMNKFIHALYLSQPADIDIWEKIYSTYIIIPENSIRLTY